MHYRLDSPSPGLTGFPGSFKLGGRIAGQPLLTVPTQDVRGAIFQAVTLRVDRRCGRRRLLVAPKFREFAADTRRPSTRIASLPDELFPPWFSRATPSASVTPAIAEQRFGAALVREAVPEAVPSSQSRIARRCICALCCRFVGAGLSV